jgi:nitroreductase
LTKLSLFDEALALAQCAPSNSNIQPWRIVFATGPARARLVEDARPSQVVENGDPLQIKAAQEFYLRSSEVLRRLDLAIEVERRSAVERIRQKQAEAINLHIAEWLRIAFAQFLSAESRSLMGIKDLAEFRLYAVDRLRGIVYAAVKTSRKTNSPIPVWAAEKVIGAWSASES